MVTNAPNGGPEQLSSLVALRNGQCTTAHEAIFARSKEESRRALTPFLKWPGGKRWLVASHAGIFPRHYNLYVEPFLGAGSVFFHHLEPRRALLGDLNPDVITAFQGVQNYPYGVQLLLEQHHIKHAKDHYYEVRDRLNPVSLTEKAARIIYLNRTCFNGIYRVNRQGAFNVPIGTKSNVVLDTDDFPSSARLLSTAGIALSDFEVLIDRAQERDLVFLDPPYTVRHNRNGFVKYNENLFSWEDQKRLAKAATRAAERGAIVVVTNAAHGTVRELYSDELFHFKIVSRFSAVAASPSSRRQYEELVITNQ